MTYHRAKGLEFDAVFLPRLLDGELPYRARASKADPGEERRLLYVGITRARDHLFLSWPGEPRSAPSPFLLEIGVVEPEAAHPVKTARSRRTGHGGCGRRPAVRPVAGMAPRAGVDRRRAGLRDLPRRDPRRDRRTRAARSGRPCCRPGHRPSQSSSGMPMSCSRSWQPADRYRNRRARPRVTHIGSYGRKRRPMPELEHEHHRGIPKQPRQGRRLLRRSLTASAHTHRREERHRAHDPVDVPRGRRSSLRLRLEGRAYRPPALVPQYLGAPRRHHRDRRRFVLGSSGGDHRNGARRGLRASGDRRASVRRLPARQPAHDPVIELVRAPSP